MAANSSASFHSSSSRYNSPSSAKRSTSSLAAISTASRRTGSAIPSRVGSPQGHPKWVSQAWPAARVRAASAITR